MRTNEVTHLTACPFTEQRKRLWGEIINTGSEQGWKPARRVAAAGGAVMMIEEADRISSAEISTFAEYRALDRNGSRFALDLVTKMAVWTLVETFGAV